MAALPRIIAFDLETTGLDPVRDSIIEIAIVERVQDSYESWTSFVNPGFPIPPEVTDITGIRDSDVADAPDWKSIKEEVTRIFSQENAYFSAHNAAFDVAFLERNGIPIPRERVIDTFPLAEVLLMEQESLNLGVLSTNFGFEASVEHRASEDARMVLDLIDVLNGRYESQTDEVRQLFSIAARQSSQEGTFGLFQSFQTSADALKTTVTAFGDAPEEPLQSECPASAPDSEQTPVRTVISTTDEAATKNALIGAIASATQANRLPIVVLPQENALQKFLDRYGSSVTEAFHKLSIEWFETESTRKKSIALLFEAIEDGAFDTVESWAFALKWYRYNTEERTSKGEPNWYNRETQWKTIFQTATRRSIPFGTRTLLVGGPGETLRHAESRDSRIAWIFLESESLENAITKRMEQGFSMDSFQAWLTWIDSVLAHGHATRHAEWLPVTSGSAIIRIGRIFESLKEYFDQVPKGAETTSIRVRTGMERNSFDTVREKLEERFEIIRQEIGTLKIAAQGYGLHGKFTEALFWSCLNRLCEFERSIGHANENILMLQRKKDDTFFLSEHPNAASDVLRPIVMDTGAFVTFIGYPIEYENGFEWFDTVFGTSSFAHESASTANRFEWLVPKKLPNVTYPKMSHVFHEMLGNFVDESTDGSGTICVISSLSGIKNAYRYFQERFGDSIELLAQWVSGGKQKISGKFFRSERKAVLLCTDFFLDDLGQSGESAQKPMRLAYCKLPFLIPTDPIHAARTDGNPEAFAEYFLPRMLLKLEKSTAKWWGPSENAHPTELGLKQALILDNRIQANWLANAIEKHFGKRSKTVYR